MSTSVMPEVKEISVAHSPDSDDAFMFYGLATNKVRTPGLRFTHTLCDIQTLNQKARAGEYELSAISYHAYPYVADKYVLLAAGSSVGDGYGPMVVATHPMSLAELKGKRIAVPGLLTTAYLTLRLMQPDLQQDANFNYAARAEIMKRYVSLSRRPTPEMSSALAAQMSR